MESVMEWLGIIAIGALGVVFLVCLCRAIIILIGPPENLK